MWVVLRQVQRSDSAASQMSQQVIPSSDIIRVWVSEMDGMETASVPAGEFVMGSLDGAGEDDEYPQRIVYLDEYWIDRTEVTNAQYRRCVETGACTAPVCETYDDAGKSDHPVVCVSWYDAQAYCEWAGRRLPTEAEWEKAARGIDGRNYPWGNEKPNAKLANFNGEVRGTTPVGQLQAGVSPFVALDMAGNVWEWTQDWYDPNSTSTMMRTNPQGPPSGYYRVLRGGSWVNASNEIRAANRHWSKPDVRYGSYGFRCARSP
jgi:serine/threonine-protein kinase